MARRAVRRRSRCSFFRLSASDSRRAARHRRVCSRRRSRRRFIARGVLLALGASRCRCPASTPGALLRPGVRCCALAGEIARPLSVLRQRRARNIWPRRYLGKRGRMNLKQLLGLDTRAERYAYARRPGRRLHVSAQKDSRPLGADHVRLLLGRAAACSSASRTAAPSACAATPTIRSTAACSARRAFRAPHDRRRQPRAVSAAAHGNGKLERVGWDDALETMASTFRDVQAALRAATPSASSAPASSSPKSSTRSASWCSSASARSNYDGNTTLCMATAVSGYKRSFGSDGPPGRLRGSRARRRRSS